MTPERWRQIEDLYHSAQEHGLSVLANADPELRLEVERLLAEDSGGKILDLPAANLLDEPPVSELDLAGQTISHYRVIEKLGAGGMGVVWKARDPRLDRFVAVKLLAAAQMGDPDRRRRFAQEARAASALNHPHIVTIYDVDRAGPEARSADFIVMEFVAGKPLHQLIPRSGMRLAEALRLAAQIADALAAAHAAGIVHRDLKPGNVMVAVHGSVKVLDFGLAKLATPRPGEMERTETIGTATQTGEGTIAGTVSYMSPEQAEGRNADARSDIFSFGAVLYEMVTGRRAFQHESRLSTLSAILRDEPPPATELSPGLPREIDRVIAHCLRKDPAERFQNMADLKIVLEDLKQDLDSGALGPAAAPRRRPSAAIAWACAGILAAGMALMWWRQAHTAVPPLQLSMRQLTADSGLTTSPVLSRDGKLVAYASDRGTHKNLNIWIHPLTAGAQPIRLTRGTADDDEPDFSPDGGLIAFHSSRDGGGIWLVPTYGGEERLLVRGGHFPRFSPDGQRIVYCVRCTGTAFLVRSQIYTVSVTGGEPKQLAADVAWVSNPMFSSDGKFVLFAGATAVNDFTTMDWWVTPAAGGPSVRTGAIAALAAQHPKPYGSLSDWVDGRVLFTVDSQVWGVPLRQPNWKIAGPARQLTTGSNTATLARAARDGLLAFNSAQSSLHLWKLRLDARTGKTLGDIERLPYAGGSQSYPSASADGALLGLYANRP
jgi:Tol biopolymer transport system component